MTKRTIPAGLIPQGVQRMFLANNATTAVNSTTRKASVLHISVEAQDARYRLDGSAPTASGTGVLLEAGKDYWLDGYNGTSQLWFIGAASGAILNIAGFNRPGDGRASEAP